jgi:hypothetical protein
MLDASLSPARPLVDGGAGGPLLAVRQRHELAGWGWLMTINPAISNYDGSLTVGLRRRSATCW